jgi:hypothetical protein
MAVIPVTEEDSLLGIYEGSLRPTQWHVRIRALKPAPGKSVILLLCSSVNVEINIVPKGICV